MWWLSYADDDGFRGVCIVEGNDLVDAAMQARRLGISPGGQVLGADIPPEELANIPERFRNRLLTQEDVAEFDPSATDLATHETQP